MIAVITVLAFFQATLVACGLPIWLIPNLSLSASFWFGVRSVDRSGVAFGITLGLLCGLQSSGSWATECLLCLLAMIGSGGLRTVISPASRAGMVILAIVVFVLLAAFEITWRLATAPLESSPKSTMIAVVISRIVVTLAILPVVISRLDRFMHKDRL